MTTAPTTLMQVLLHVGNKQISLTPALKGSYKCQAKRVHRRDNKKKRGGTQKRDTHITPIQVEKIECMPLNYVEKYRIFAPQPVEIK